MNVINADELKFFCSRAGISLNQLAAALKIDPATLHRKLNGSSDFYRHEILAIKEILELNVDEMNQIFF